MNFYTRFTPMFKKHRRLIKTLLVMKFAIFIIMLTCLQASATVYAQQITLSEKNVSVEKVFKTIQKQTNYIFWFEDNILKNAKHVDINLKGATLKEAMDKCLAGQPLTYAIVGQTVVIKKKLSPIDEQPYLQVKNVKGKVVDENKKPLPGASVSVKGTSLGATTNANGEFAIKNVPEEATLVISFIGYDPKEISVTQNLDTIQLMPASSKLNDVIIVAYGATSRRKIASAVSTLAMDNVASIPVQSINDAVGGRIPGVIVTTSDGAPGTKSQISIRGGNAPVFVIDNVIRSQSDFENLNPNDIENYSVLKDAAATSLYGALGGNGVVLVTTKKGKEGQATINYSYNTILSQPTITPVKLSSYDHLNALNQVYIAEGKTPPTADSTLNYYKNQSQPFVYPNTNWQAVSLHKYAIEQRHDLSVTAGNRLLTYYASGSYYHQGSDLKTDNNYNNRITYRLNTVSNFDNIKLKVTTALDGYIEDNDVPAAGYFGIYSHIQNHSPSQLAYNNLGLPSANTVDNPVTELSPLSGYSKGTTRVFNSILGLDWETPFVKDLHVKLTGNYNMYNSLSKSWDMLAPSYANNSTTPIYSNPPSLYEGSGQGSTLLLQAFLTYTKSFGDHNIDFTGGYEQAANKSSSLSAERQQYQILYDQFVAGPTINQLANGSEAESGRAGYISRLSYNYKSKYFLEGTFRYDANDLLPPTKHWGSFYALSGGWLLTEENFMQTLKDKHVFDFLKLRGSYGLTGTLDGISPFQYVSGYNINNNAWVINGVPVQGTAEPGSIPSTNYSWYSIRSRDFGLDFASLKNHLTGSVDYYFTRTTGYVTAATQYAATLGIGLPPTNFNAGALRKEGAEFNVAWNDKVGKDFTYKVGVNFTYFNQLWERALEDDVALENPYTRISGNGFYLTQGYINEGYYQQNSDLLNGPRRPSSVNVVGGDLRYEDVNGDGKIDASDFRNIGSTTFPHINYGLTVDLTYKGFYMNAVVMGAGSRDRYMGDVIQGSSAQGILVYGFQQNYWTPENTNALYPRQVSSTGVNGNNNYASSDFWIMKSSYIRLKYLQFGYDFKKTLVKKAAFKNLKLFVSGTNLLTASNSLKYYIDPESDTNNYNYPVQRTIALGMNASF